ncbi:MAG: hypothetical protein HKM87_06025 [Ignavibacteriaceae bacterium]|nr:hypothetical protein [Ignavibacteriaceae bacterium]
MKRTLFILFSFIVVSSLSINAQMKLNLSQEITGEQPTSFMENNLESNLKLELPPEVTNPAGNEFLKMWFVGLLADATLPMGDFGDSWSTGFSAHAMVGYMIARSLLLNVSAGYVTFSEKESVEGVDQSYSWIPIFLGLNYVFNPGKKFMPYLGVALGMYFISYSITQTIFGQTYDFSGNDSEFGITPRLGAYFLVSAAILLSISAEYNMIFTSGSTTSAIGVLFGAMFALH